MACKAADSVGYCRITRSCYWNLHGYILLAGFTCVLCKLILWFNCLVFGILEKRKVSGAHGSFHHILGANSTEHQLDIQVAIIKNWILEKIQDWTFYKIPAKSGKLLTFEMWYKPVLVGSVEFAITDKLRTSLTFSKNNFIPWIFSSPKHTSGNIF